MATILDYSAQAIPAALIRAAGHLGAIRYISPAREQWMKGKPATADEVADFKANALDTAFVWQYGGVANPDCMRGFKGGKQDAKAADKQLKAIKRTGYPVFFAVDFDITLAQWNAVAVNYFKAACEVLGRERVGIYGHSRVCDWAREDGVIGSAGEGKFLQWQTTSWSDGHVSPHAVLLQSKHNVTGPTGLQVDVNQVLHTYWGQHPPRPDQAAGAPTTDPVAIPEAPALKPAPKPTAQFKCDTDLLTWRDNGISRHKRRFIVIHTDESGYNYATRQVRDTAWTAKQLAEYNRRRDISGGSYHVGIGRSGDTCRQNDDVYGTWSVGSIGNDQAFHVCLTGTAFQTRQQWLTWGAKQLQKLADVLAHYCRFHNIAVQRVAPPQMTQSGVTGICGHWDCSKFYGGSTHWDPGGYDGSTGVPKTAGGFPWDVVLAKTRERMTSVTPTPPAPAPTPAEKEREMLNEKLQSIINPKVWLTVGHMIRLTDAYLWEFRVILKEIAKKQGIDYDAVVNEAIARDRKEVQR
ncbi:glycoside hydrolase domain-containing protein [uncultured Corynebacterium sp.]|uniref:glycoside hydrolase domain-containing protein n=1 Tax=uncultured Corynebacterium sp. TaxID=159447 RepID=UPI0026283009|nr:glycoside hydrolase domain-containing protein [uncultured Corynebacterium sp.]